MSRVRTLSAQSSPAPVYAVRTYDQSLPFYLKRVVALVDYRDELTLGLSQAPERGIATLADFSTRWQTSDAGYAVMPFETYDALVEQGVAMRAIARYRAQKLVGRRQVRRRRRVRS